MFYFVLAVCWLVGLVMMLRLRRHVLTIKREGVGPTIARRNAKVLRAYGLRR